MRAKSFLLFSTLLFNTGLLAKPSSIEYVPGEYIIKVKGNKINEFFARKGLSGIQIKRTIPVSFGSFFVGKANDDKSFNLERLKNDPSIEYIEPNYIYRAFGNSGIPNDPMFDKLWGLLNTGTNEPPRTDENSNIIAPSSAGVVGNDINAIRAWQITKGSKRIKIAVIDTGIDYTHPDLKNNIWVNEKELNGRKGIDDDGNGYVDDIHGYNFADNNGDPMDYSGHGTHVSGTIGATHDNDTGVAGVMGEVSLVALKFLGENGAGTTEDAIKAVDYATSMNVDIMSNSWGGGAPSMALQEAIKRASEKGIVFVAAAGNSSSNNDLSPAYPASYNLPNVISVAATNAQEKLASFSCYGKKTVHVAAPGNHILSTTPKNSYSVFSGTSMAAPHVSGVIGLLLSHVGRLDHEILKQRLLATSVPVTALRGKTMSGGRIDVYNLLTDTRPVHTVPDTDDWKEWRLEAPFESHHPYGDNLELGKKFTIPFANVKYVRAVIKRFDMEKGYDYIRVGNGNGLIADTVSGKGENYKTEYVNGNVIDLLFRSDSSVNKWGFIVESLEYID